jgi:hypothetical protein
VRLIHLPDGWKVFLPVVAMMALAIWPMMVAVSRSAGATSVNVD